MLKKFSLIFAFLMFFICLIYFVPHNKMYEVTNVINPCQILLKNTTFKLNNIYIFDNFYYEHNKCLAKTLNITEDEAFLLGVFGKYWAENLLKNRNVYIKNNDLIYLKYSYKTKFLHSGFCIVNNKPYSTEAFNYQLNKIRKGHFCIVDLKTDKILEFSKNNLKNIPEFLIMRKSGLYFYKQQQKLKQLFNKKNNKKHIRPSLVYTNTNIKMILSDFLTNLKPNNNCSTDMCKELVSNINNSKYTIDMAIYGYSRVPKIEEALINAQKRGVKIRLVYDQNKKGENIYPDTNILVQMLKENKSDIKSNEANAIMHNKFYIFDNKILITGSANLSHTDMSDFNSNNIIVLNDKKAAEIYKNEFDKMFNGNFHSQKTQTINKQISPTITAYFSPQDKSSKNVIIPVIQKAQKYIYISIFVLTDNNIVNALIESYKRGVDVKILADSLITSTKNSKIKVLRTTGIPVKIENYAGKMHSKILIADDKYTMTGSMNFSYSGENKNDENIIVIENSEITRFYKKFFEYQWNAIDDKWLKYTPKAESKNSIGSCSDGIDNDYDGFTDLQDSACQ